MAVPWQPAQCALSGACVSVRASRCCLRLMHKEWQIGHHLSCSCPRRTCSLQLAAPDSERTSVASQGLLKVWAAGLSARGCAGNLPHPEAKDDGCLGAAQAAVWQVIMCFIGLLLRVYDACVPPTASYGCEVWGCYSFLAASSVLRAPLAQQHLQTLKHILGVRLTVNTHVLWQEVPVKRLEVVWLQRTVKFYNRLAAAPNRDLYRRIAIASCRSALSQNVRNWGIGYTFQIRADDLDLVVEHTLDIKLKAKYDAIWQDLPFSPRTCPSQGASLCTYGAWFARPAHIHPKAIFRLPMSAGCVQTLLRFRMGCHNLPWDLGRRQGIPRLHRVCLLCAGENPGDEQHVVFECPGLQDIRDRYQGLFGEHATTVLQFMWQDDIRGVAMFIKECLGVYYGTDPCGGQASDQP